MKLHFKLSKMTHTNVLFLLAQNVSQIQHISSSTQLQEYGAVAEIIYNKEYTQRTSKFHVRLLVDD